MQNFYNRKKRISDLLCSAKFILFPIAFLALHTVNAQTTTPDLTIDNVSQSEGNSGTTTFTFTVSLSSPAGAGGVTFDITTVDATAQDDNPVSEDNDYVQNSLTNQTIAQGNSTYTFDVTVNGDIVAEINESFAVNVTNVTGANVTDGNGLGGINNDDISVSVAVSPASVSEDGGTNLVYTFTRNVVLSGSLVVNFSIGTGGNNATFATDYTQSGATTYTPPTGTVTIPSGNSSATVTIDPTPDGDDEPDETIILTVTSGSGYLVGSPSTATGTITNDDAPAFDPCANIGTLTCETPVTATISGDGAWNITACGGNTPGQERVYSFTAAITGTHNLQVTATSGTVFRYFYKLASDGCDATDWICITGTSTPLTIPFGPLTGGTAYYILLDPLFTSAESQTFQINCAPDPCANIPALTCGTPASATTSGAGAWNIAACGGSTPGQERVYSFTPAITGAHNLQVTAVTAAFEYFYKPASDGCDATDWICIGVAGGVTTLPIGTLTAGVTYYILQDARLTTASSQTFQINCPTAFDPCANITTLACATPVTATTSGAGVWNITACGGNTPGQERIYSFTPAVTGLYDLQVTATSGANFNYFYKEASDGCDATDWICIAGVSTPTSVFGIGPLTAGVTYYILQDAALTSASSQTFQINCPPDPCANISTLACATPVTAAFSGSGVWSLTGCGFNTPGRERVYSFTPTVTGVYNLEVTAASGGFVDYFYKAASDGCDATDWICINDITVPGVHPIGTLTAGIAYYILLDDENAVSSSHTFQINCPAACVPPTINTPTVTQPTCATPTGTIVVNATGSGTLEYQLNAGTFQLSNTFSGLAPGSYNISVRLQSSPACLSTYSGNPVVLNAATGCCVAPVITTPTVTQPTCATPTGTIVVNATGSGTLEYQLNAGTFQPSNTFSGLAPGNYNITVRLQSSPACLSTYSGNPVVLNAATGCCVAPVITTPTVTQPTCATPTGTIVVNATGSGTLEYQLNAGTFQPSNTFSSLAPGSYNITVRLQSSPACLSTYSGNPVVLNAATGCCVAPVITTPTVTQPTCTVPTGKIVVNATGSGTLQYRLNSGSWQNSKTFSGLAPGSYNISVRLKYNTSCVTNYSGNPVILNPATGCCVAPTVTAPTVTQPTCAVPTGAIVVNATGSGTLEYRLNSGSWQTSNTFSGIAPGSYDISVRLKYNTSCCTYYNGNPVVLNPATGCCVGPVITAPTVTQPTCEVPTGKIVVNATGSGTLQYRLNSGSWQTSKTFSGLAPGSYNITVRLKYNTSCYTSYSGNPVVLNAATGCCAAPVINAPTVTQPTCAVPTGKIVVNATCAGTMEYQLNSGSWQTSNTFSGLAPGSYNITARLKYNTSCYTSYSGNPVVLNAATTCGTVDPNKCYKIVNRKSGKALSIEYCSTSDNKGAEQQNSSNCMIWKFVQVQTGYYKIINVHSGKSLEVKYGSSSDNKNIVQSAYSGHDYEKWSLTAAGAYFVVKAKHSGKAMSVKNASTSNGADVVQKGTGNNSNEQWSIVEVSCSNNEEERGVISKVPPVISSEEEELSVTATPNPGISFFNLALKSDDKTTPVNIRILDVSGKVISARQKVNVSSTIRIAADKWAAGIYFAEVIQGGQRKVVKMIKVN